MTSDKEIRVTPSGHNERTCLPDSVNALLPLEKKELVHSAMVADTLSNRGLSLEGVSGNCLRRGGWRITY